MPLHIIWDNDGMLVDTERLYFLATRAVMREVDYELTEALYREHFLKKALGTWHVLQSQGISDADIERLRDHRIIKALSFKQQDVNEHVKEWQDAPPNVAGLVWDTPPKSNGDLTGGSGVTFDWSAMAALQNENALDGLPPMVLAGGLCADNVAEAIHMIQPYSVDVSSGVESSRGVKCAKRIAAFCDAVRKADG